MLSICIPTYNRYRFLEWTLARLERDFPHAEIIVSDNASDDFTAHMNAYPARLIHQRENIGPFPNMLAALKMATSKYAVYCADDDYLLPDQVAIGIEYLENHPKVAAYCAPCEIWDEVENSPYWNAFKVEHERLYGERDGMDLFNFIIGGHIWPEHFIYRVPVPIEPRTRAYWAFADLPSLIRSGGVYVARTPFYRNLLTHPMGDRVQLGNVQCLTLFDEYRAGLEVLACELFGNSLPYALRHQLQEMIQAFICTRIAVARSLYLNAGDTQSADMLAKRLCIADPRRDLGVAA